MCVLKKPIFVNINAKKCFVCVCGGGGGGWWVCVGACVNLFHVIFLLPAYQNVASQYFVQRETMRLVFYSCFDI